METGEPDKQALELIRKTEAALAARQAEAEKKAHAILQEAKAQAAALVREKEEELAQARRRMETQVMDMGMASPPALAPVELDPAARLTAERIARALFDGLTGREGAK